ncbi:MAG TPA: GTP-binding protein, partial [Candidatus Avilachnospira avistercoris]|nr:GTP-binding protein [Candidatus Avilachnospira avistercoris]
DGGFLKDAGIEIREMSQGCICCSLVGDFEKALKEVISTYEPERVIIEPSGVGKLSDVMKAVTDASENLDVQLNSAVTIVDANKCKMYMKNFGEFFNNQVQYAGTVVLSRTDIISDEEKIDNDVELIRSLNPTAEIITTPVSELSGEKLLSIMEKRDGLLSDLIEEARREAAQNEHHHHHHHHGEDEECGHEHHHGDEHGHHHEHEEHEHHHDHDEHDGECCHEHHHEHHHETDEECHEHHHDEGCCHEEHEHHEHHHHEDEECCCGHHHHHHDGHDADEVFDSWGRENIAPITKERLETILKAFSEGNEYGEVIRSKGMIASADEKGAWYYFDFVPGEYEIRAGEPEHTGKACVIGRELKTDKLKALFD